MNGHSQASRRLPKVCVIGAGSSGIATSKVLDEHGFPFDCFEKASDVGGLWWFGHDAGHNAAYRSLHINTSKDIMQFSDYPMPADYPDYPSHKQIADYFAEYIDHFGFRDKIKLNTEVTRCERRADGVWLVTLDDGTTHEYDALIVANGHHWNPRWPEPAFPGEFDGVQMHAHDYEDNSGLRDKNVIVVGMGNSAMDIAVESSQVAKNVYLSARRGVHVLPKYAFGQPFDHLEPKIPLPWPVKKRLAAGILRISVGKVEDYGLPKPDHDPGESHPTVSSDILHKVGHGFVKPVANIKELRGDRVELVDGSVVEADVIVYCTGYKVTFPFFDEDFICAPDNDLPLFRRVFKPDIDNVFFVGLLQPLGAIMPLAEIQSKLVAAFMEGDYALPAPDKLRRQIDHEREQMFNRYVTSKRHTMQVDFREYRSKMAMEDRVGRLRARRARRGMPIAPLAQGEPVTATR
jgi:hypothetical protein